MKEGSLVDWSGIVGLVLVGVGAVLGAAVVGWTLAPLVLIALGVVLGVVWMATHRQALADMAGLRSTQTNANVLVSVVAFGVIIVLVNVLAVRFDTRFDLTAEGFYTLSPQTTQVIEQLPQPVKVWAVSSVPDPNLREQLERYRRVNPEQFEYAFINPRNNPVEARRLEINQDQTLVVESGSRKQQIPQPPIPELESQLTPLILQVTDAEALKSYFIEGHGELPLNSTPGSAGLAQMAAALGREGFEATALNLLRNDIPEDAGIVVLAGPEQPLLPGEAEKLATYLEQGGSALLLLNPQMDPGLDELFDDWGIELAEDVIVDRVSESIFRSGPLVALGSAYGSHPITADLSQRGVVSIFPLARSITLAERPDVTAVQLVSTGSQEVWGEVGLDLNNPPQTALAFDPSIDLASPLGLGAALSRPVEGSPPTEDDEAAASPDEARLVIFGNVNFAIDGNFNQQGNGDLFLNSMNWLADQQDRISIRPKSPTNRRFELNARDVALLWVVSVLGLPVLALGSGVVLWWRRR
ncbi:MAG: GldG family protein [Cyanophyceae cyanobacterium]